MDKSDKYISALLFIFSLTLYIVTMPPTIFWQDAGIYAAGIWVEGNVYSPGYPLYMILGIIWKNLLPISEFIQKIHSMSAIFIAVSSVFVYKIAYCILSKKDTLYKKIISTDKQKDVEKSTNIQDNTTTPSECFIKTLSIAASVLFMLNFNIWSQANNAEVYAFHTLFFSVVLFITLLIGINGRIEKQIDPKTNKYIIILAIIYGLSFGNHPMTVVLIPTLAILLVLQSNILFHKKTLAIAATLFVISASITYLYLPIKASTEPPLNWGNPNTLERFIKHVSGSVYLTGKESIVFNDITRYQAALQEFIWEFSYIGIVLALGGAIILSKRNKTLFVLLISIIIFHIFFAILYKQTTEYNSWLIPSHIAVIFLLITSVHELIIQTIKSKQNNQIAKSIMYTVPVALFFVFIVSHAIETAKELDRRQYYYAEDFGKNILRNLDQNSIIFLTGDQESSTIMYLQLVKNYKPDVIAIKNTELEEFITPDGRSLLQKKYPQLKLPEYLGTEEDLSTYFNTLIKHNLSEKKSVYLMSKNIFEIDTTQFNLVPAAAMWKIAENQNEDIDLKYWNFEYHDPQFYLKRERPLMSLKDPNKPGGINRVPFIQHMINFELQSWKNLGDIYIQKGECNKAENAYNKMKNIKETIFTELPQIEISIEKCKNSI